MLRTNEKALLNDRDEFCGLPRDEAFLWEMKSRYEFVMGSKLGFEISGRGNWLALCILLIFVAVGDEWPKTEKSTGPCAHFSSTTVPLLLGRHITNYAQHGSMGSWLWRLVVCSGSATSGRIFTVPVCKPPGRGESTSLPSPLPF